MLLFLPAHNQAKAIHDGGSGDRQWGGLRGVGEAVSGSAHQSPSYATP